MSIRSPILALLVALAATTTVASAAVPAPGVDWRRSDWYPLYPGTSNWIWDDDSGEDWWYAHKTTISGDYIAAGYAGFVNYTIDESTTGGCLQQTLGPPDCFQFETASRIKGGIRAALALVPSNGGAPSWYRIYGEGAFFQVIQTTDGGYLAVGASNASRDELGAPLGYLAAPGAPPGQFHAAACPTGSVTHMLAVKTDALGNVLWQHLYGATPYDSLDPAAAYARPGIAYDVVETSFGYAMVGQAEDPDPAHVYDCSPTNTGRRTPRAVVIELWPDGSVKSTSLHGRDDRPSAATAIDRIGNDYVVAGTEYVPSPVTNPATACDFVQRVFVTRLGAVTWSRDNFPSSSTTSQATYDVAISTSGDVLAPMIVDCVNCIYTNSSGTAKVYRLHPTTGGNDGGPTTLGPVTAYDLKIGITPTADDGFAIVSSRQTSPPPPDAPSMCWATGTWNTDAYVAKVGPTGTIEWETTFDVDGQAAAAAFPGDVKKQECLYTISEALDGGFVVAGNNSYNFDDAYLAKLLPAPPAPAADLMIRDTPQDVGLEPNPDGGPMWVSEDLWVRNEPGECGTHLPHENPIYTAGTPRYVCVRVHNRGTTPASGTVYVHWAKASTGLAWPLDWTSTLIGGVAAGALLGSATITSLAPGASTTFELPWSVPDPASFPPGPDAAHFCLLGRVEELTTPFTFAEGPSVWSNVKLNNDAAWKNVTIVTGVMKGGKPRTGQVLVRNVETVDATLRLRAAIRDRRGNASDAPLRHAALALRLDEPLLQRWRDGGMQGDGIRARADGAIELLAPDAWIGGLAFAARETHPVAIEVTQHASPDRAEDRDFTVDLVQSSEVRGGDRVQVGGERFTIALDDEPPPEEEPDGCGCRSGTGAAPLALVALLVLVRPRRRQRV